MLNIIASDLYHIKKSFAVYIALFLVLIMSVISIVGMSAGHIGLSVGQSNINLNDTEFIEELSKAKSLQEVRKVMQRDGAFPLDKDIIGQNVNLYYVFIIITVIVLVTDFSNKAVKNTLSSAVSRKTYYLSKTIIIFGICTILILFSNYFSYFLNLIVNGESFSTPFWEFTKITLVQLPLLYGIISLLICFAFLLKKTSLFNTISIPFILLVQIIVMAITNLFKIKADWFYNYEIQFALSKLTDNPSNKYVMTCIILGIIYIVLFNLIGYFSFKKTEIK